MRILILKKNDELIHKLLRDGKSLILHGESGIGKSQTANRAARALNYKTEWITASNTILLKRDLRKCFHISITDVDEMDELNKQLAACQTGELIIFDNVENPYLLNQIIHISCQAQIIITTALEPPSLVNGFHCVKLERWGRTQALDFLKNRRLPSSTNIRRDGSYSPLVLELTVAFVRETGGEWGYIWNNLMNLDIPQCVSSLYTLLEHREYLGNHFAHCVLQLLRFSAILCGDFISNFIYQSLTGFDDKIIKEALLYLDQLSLIRYEDSKALISLSIQKAVQACMGEEHLKEYQKQIIHKMEISFKELYLRPDVLNNCREWRVHIEYMLSPQLPVQNSKSQELLLNLLAGKYDYATGEYICAEKSFRRVKERAAGGGLASLRREAMIELARLLEGKKENQGVTDEIDQLFHEWPDLDQEHPELYAEALLIASQAEINSGSYTKAKALLKTGLQVLESSGNLSEEPLEEKRIDLLNGIGQICFIERHYQKAENIFRKAFDFCRPKNKFQAAMLYGNLGIVLVYRKNFKAAESCLLEQQKIYRTFYQDGLTCDELTNLNSLFILYLKMKRNEEAEKYWELIEKRIKEGGQKHWLNKIYLYNNYGVYMYKAGNLEMAQSIFSAAICLCEQEDCNKENMVIIQLLINYAHTLYKKGNPYMAVYYLEKAFRKYDKKDIQWKWRKPWLLRHFLPVHLKYWLYRYYSRFLKI